MARVSRDRIDLMGLWRRRKTSSGRINFLDDEVKLAEDPATLRGGGGARDGQNLMPRIVSTVESYATVREIANSLRSVFGEYRETVVV